MRCLHPLTIQNPRFNTANQQSGDSRFIQVPCGDCYACRQTIRSQWNFRLTEQLAASESAVFLTLTYSPAQVPVYLEFDNDTNTVVRGDFFSMFPQEQLQHIVKSELCFDISDVQKFLKRLRKRYPANIFRYYCISEYGEHTSRPHYHMLLFSTLNPDYLQHNYMRIQDIDYMDIWRLGNTCCGSVTAQSIQYVTKQHLLSKDDKKQHVFPPFQVDV